MTVDTVFDIASLTKVVVTTPSIMLLIEQGRLRLKDRVSYYVPNFGRHNKSKITIRHLLTHMSGLRADLDLTKSWKGYDKAITLATEEVPLAKPGTRFIYSDINFFLLGHIVKIVSGISLDKFAQNNLFEPLDMKDTMFNPPGSLRSRIAPTGRYRGPGKPVFRGRVHDPTAGRMGGVAGHAGLFTTADDLANFCRMLVNGGSFGGRSVCPHDHPENDFPGHTAKRAQRSRPRLGFGLQIFSQPWRSFSSWFFLVTPALPARPSGSTLNPVCTLFPLKPCSSGRGRETWLPFAESLNHSRLSFERPISVIIQIAKAHFWKSG